MAKAIDTLSIKLDFKDPAGAQHIINKLSSSLKGLDRIITGDTKPAIQKLRNEINTFAGQGNKSISTIDAQVTALRALRREADINSREFKQLTADISKFEKQLGKTQARRQGGGGAALRATQTAGAVISGGIFGGPEGAIGGLLGAPFGVGGAFAGAAIGGQIGMIRQSLGGVAETVAEINSMKIALAGVSESAEDYQQSFQNVIEISKQFLFPVDRAIGEFTKLKAAVVGAGFGTEETTDVFKGFAAAILATGGNAEKLSGALLAASQVFSKGKVQAEELRGQIGERLPGAFTTFAQSIGVSSRDLDEMLRKGEVSTENFVEFTRTLFSRYEKTAETLGSSPEKAGQRLQLALSLATLEYGGFFQKVGAGFQDYVTNLVNFAVKNKEGFKKVIAQATVFAGDIKTIITDIVERAKEAFGGLFTFLVQTMKFFAKNIVMPFINTLFAAIKGLSDRMRLGTAERKLGGPFGRAREIRLEELERYKKEEGMTAFGRAGVSLAAGDEIERRAQQRILEEAGMAIAPRDERVASAMSRLDKAFAQFDPTSFGTSLGDKPDLSGSGGGSNTVQQIKDITEAQAKAQIKAIQNRTRGIELTKEAIAKEAELARVAAEKLPPNKKSVELARIAQKEANQLNRLQQEELRTANNVAKAKLGLNELLTKAKGEQGLLNDEQLRQELNQIKVNDLMMKYNILVQEGVISTEELRKKLEEAVAAMNQADSPLKKFKDGLKKVFEEAINLKDALAVRGVEAVKQFGDAFADFVATGKSSFRELTVSILQDLSRIFARAALFKSLSLIPGVGNFLSLTAANGAVVSSSARNGIVPYAKGGIVNKPTLFQYANGGSGRFGLMGEAGPEAIMPLRRGRNGKLGVESSGSIGNVVVNVDASGSSAQGDQPNAKALGQAIGAAVQAELIKQKRPGGLLS
jgi:lambda family phage tail tape measure protein